jgi:hypothetical protein
MRWTFNTSLQKELPVLLSKERWDNPLLRASSAKIKRKGERGSPSLNPLPELKNLEMIPFRSKESPLFSRQA